MLADQDAWNSLRAQMYVCLNTDDLYRAKEYYIDVSAECAERLSQRLWGYVSGKARFALNFKLANAEQHLKAIRHELDRRGCL